MSDTYSYLAARCGVEDLQNAVLGIWHDFEPVGSVVEFATFDEAWEWAAPRSGYLHGAHPDDAKLFFRDGDWSVIADFSLCMSSEDNALAELSRRVGRVIIASAQGEAGYAEFRVFDAGALVRSIILADREITPEGEPLAEEAGMSLEKFSFENLDVLRQRFGLSSFLEQEPHGPVWALAIVDRLTSPPAA